MTRFASAERGRSVSSVLDLSSRGANCQWRALGLLMRHKVEAEADGDEVASRRRRTLKRKLLSLVVVIALVGLLMLAFKSGLVNVAATAFGQWFAGLLLNH